MFVLTNILTSSVIYYWTDARQHRNYLLVISKERARGGLARSETNSASNQVWQIHQKRQKVLITITKVIQIGVLALKAWNKYGPDQQISPIGEINLISTETIHFLTQLQKHQFRLYWKGTARLTVPRNMNPMYWLLFGLYGLKNAQFLQKMYELLSVFATLKFCSFTKSYVIETKSYVSQLRISSTSWLKLVVLKYINWRIPLVWNCHVSSQKEYPHVRLYFRI